MDPPFTRDRLRNIAVEMKKKQYEETVQMTADDIKSEILWAASNPGTQRRGVYVQTHLGSKVVINFNQIRYRYPPDIRQPYPQGKELLSDLIAKLKVMFPDSAFQTDPLDTYLIIDWS